MCTTNVGFKGIFEYTSPHRTPSPFPQRDDKRDGGVPVLDIISQSDIDIFFTSRQKDVLMKKNDDSSGVGEGGICAPELHGKSFPFFRTPQAPTFASVGVESEKDYVSFGS